MQVWRDYRLVECETTMRRLTPIAIREVAVFNTEDVAPVTHAHWKEYVDVGGAIYIECSACGLIWWLDEGTAEENEMFYCPKCGAKMDEEVEDG